MAIGIRCFAGANTQNGFYSGFDGIFLNRSRVFYIKGAPGVGKSGLLKRIFKRQMACGHAVSAFYCSSDPDSLDGVVDETLNCALMDATAPHSYDPILPGARDTLLSLGDFLNEDALTPDARSMEMLQTEISREFRAASSCLRAADGAFEASRIFPDDRRMRLAAREIRLLLPVGRASRGTEKRYFLSAHTCRGHVQFMENFAPEITVSIPAPFGASADGLIRRVRDDALDSGLEVISFVNPIDPARLDHLFIPEIPLFLTGANVSARRVYDGVFPENVESDTLYTEACARAHEHLLRAKALHDELEGFYIPRMDFSRLVEVESRIYSALDRLENQRSKEITRR